MNTETKNTLATWCRTCQTAHVMPDEGTREHAAWLAGYAAALMDEDRRWDRWGDRR